MECVSTDSKACDSDRGNVDHYRVVDWNAFAGVQSLKTATSTRS